jgi:hypothetical protein
MKTIVGIALLVFGMIALLVANFLPFQAEADLLDKRPRLSGRFPIWWSMKQHPEIQRLYKSEFPNGQKYRWSRMWAVIALSSFVAGLLMLLEVK